MCPVFSPANDSSRGQDHVVRRIDPISYPTTIFDWLDERDTWISTAVHITSLQSAELYFRSRSSPNQAAIKSAPNSISQSGGKEFGLEDIRWNSEGWQLGAAWLDK